MLQLLGGRWERNPSAEQRICGRSRAQHAIWTFDGKGELLLTIMSSLAQEESRSISENCTWGQRKRFADGKVTVPFNRFLGYDRGPDGNLVVNREQAAIVQRIYAMEPSTLMTTSVSHSKTDRKT